MAWLSRFRGGDSSPDWTSVAITLVTIGVVLALGFQIVGADLPSQRELSKERAAFAEYCHAEFGEDADVYRANDAMSAEHNGLHCDHDAGTVHRTQIPNEVWDAYMAGEVSADYVTSQLEEPPGIFLLPTDAFGYVGVGMILLIVIVVYIWMGVGPVRF